MWIDSSAKPQLCDPSRKRDESIDIALDPPQILPDSPFKIALMFHERIKNIMLGVRGDIVFIYGPKNLPLQIERNSSIKFHNFCTFLRLFLLTVYCVKFLPIRVSSETSFVAKQPKLEPKLVSALSETRRLFRLFRFDIKKGSFAVSKQPKQTKD